MNVTLYSKEKDCAPCVEAKRFLSANQIPYIEKDVADRDNLMELVKQFRLMTVPVLVVNDNKPIVGFNQSDYKTALGLS